MQKDFMAQSVSEWVCVIVGLLHVHVNCRFLTGGRNPIAIDLSQVLKLWWSSEHFVCYSLQPVEKLLHCPFSHTMLAKNGKMAKMLLLVFKRRAGAPQQNSVDHGINKLGFYVGGKLGPRHKQENI